MQRASTASWIARGVSLLFAAGLAGCGLLGPRTPGMSVVRQTIDADFYASAQVLTPDPLAADYPFGERLIVSWSLPPDWLDVAPHELRIEVIYRNRAREIFSWQLDQQRGTVALDCIGPLFTKTRGWMTYNVELLSEGQVILTEPHQLWFRWIDTAA